MSALTPAWPSLEQAQTLLVSRKQVTVCSVGTLHTACPAEGDSLLDPRALEPFAHTSP